MNDEIVVGRKMQHWELIDQFNEILERWKAKLVFEERKSNEEEEVYVLTDIDY